MVEKKGSNCFMKRTLFGVLGLVVFCNTSGMVSFAQEAAAEAEAVEAPKEPIFPDKNLEAVVRKSVYAKRNNDEPIT